MITPPAAISLKGINQFFGKTHALVDVDLQLAAGHRHALVGPNGSGKTTLLRLMAGLLVPASGQATCLGFELPTKADEFKHRVAHVTQGFSLYEELTIDENLTFVADLYCVAGRTDALERTRRAFELTSNARQRAGAVSVGVRQRLMLAAAFMRNPALLLLDEPTAALDDRSRSRLWARLDAAQALGTTVVLTTHHVQDQERCCSTTTLADGRVADQQLTRRT
jgi:ABC-2 type transport system ATP-binding protein